MEVDQPSRHPMGKSVYYLKGEFPGSLWRMSASGGQENQVLPSVAGRAFSVVSDGIYFIPETDADDKPSIQFLSFANGKVKVVAPASGHLSEGLSVSPDGRFLLFTHWMEPAAT